MGNIVVKLTTDEGLVGLGDTQSILGRQGPGSQVATVRAIADCAPLLVDHDPLELNRILQSLDAALGPHMNYAKHPIDLALHDLAAKTFGVPLSALFGGAVRDWLPAELHLYLGEPSSTQERARRAAVEEGYRFIALTLWGDVDRDVSLIAATSEAVQGAAKIKVDANGAYTYPQAKVLLHRIERYGIDVVEQPLPLWDLEGLRRLRQDSPIPIVLDESAVSVESVMTSIQLGICDGVNVKPIRLGGLRNAWRTITNLAAANLLCLAGTGVATGIGMAAFNHLFAAAPNLYRGVIGSSAFFFGTDIVCNPAPMAPQVMVTGGPGIGVELDDEILSRLRADR